MCNGACIAFAERVLTASDIADKDVIESGSLDINGSVRPYIESLNPASYLGTDVVTGARVDKVCSALDLVEEFGEESFDVVISTEAVEHIRDWRTAFSNFKRVLTPGGVIVITTRSAGFGYHGCGQYGDYWRYEVDDMKEIFADFGSLIVESDPFEPGVFLKAWKPFDWKEKDLSSIKLERIRPMVIKGNAPISKINGMPGWVTDDEQEYLVELAKGVPKHGTIVNVGSEFGLSPSLLCHGSDPSVQVFSIDLFPGELLSIHDGNMVEVGCADRVVTIQSDSAEAGATWDEPADLIFIDAAHDYEAIKKDIAAWTPNVKEGGVIAFHDCANMENPMPHYLHFDVTKAVSEWYWNAAGKWQLLRAVRTILAFKRLPEPSAPKKATTVTSPRKKATEE